MGDKLDISSRSLRVDLLHPPKLYEVAGGQPRGTEAEHHFL